LAAAAEFPSENTAQRIAHLLVTARPDASLESLAARIPGRLEIRLAGEYACLASRVEQHPETLAEALAGPPLQQDAVLEFGMVTAALALLGTTHGAPGLDASSLGGNELELRHRADCCFCRNPRTVLGAGRPAARNADVIASGLA
jgi:hypothetical protein